LQNHDYATYGHVEVYSWDLFYIAAHFGSTEALDLLIKHYNAHSTDTNMIPLVTRGFRLVHEACLERPYRDCAVSAGYSTLTGKPHTEDDSSVWQDETPLLSAGYGLSF
jgi:hypothetical protein